MPDRVRWPALPYRLLGGLELRRGVRQRHLQLPRRQRVRVRLPEPAVPREL